MKRSLTSIVFFLVAILAGCSNAPSTIEPAYSGHSRHLRYTQGESNILVGYDDCPRLVEGTQRWSFELKAERYLKAVKSDMDFITVKMKNAEKKIDVVRQATAYGGQPMFMTPVGDVFETSYEGSNFRGISRYRDFFDFSYSYPSKPYASDSWQRLRYERDILDYYATVESYLQDGAEYINNCKRDYAMVQGKGFALIAYLESHGIVVPTRITY